MADFEVVEIAGRDAPEGSEQPFVYRLVCWFGRQRKIFHTEAPDVERAIELAYYYFTGKAVQFVGEKDARTAIIFSETPANAEDFEDLAAVPPWAELPF